MRKGTSSHVTITWSSIEFNSKFMGNVLLHYLLKLDLGKDSIKECRYFVKETTLDRRERIRKIFNIREAREKRHVIPFMKRFFSYYDDRYSSDRGRTRRFGYALFTRGVDVGGKSREQKRKIREADRGNQTGGLMVMECDDFSHSGFVLKSAGLQASRRVALRATGGCAKPFVRWRT